MLNQNHLYLKFPDWALLSGGRHQVNNNLQAQGGKRLRNKYIKSNRRLKLISINALKIAFKAKEGWRKSRQKWPLRSVFQMKTTSRTFWKFQTSTPIKEAISVSPLKKAARTINRLINLYQASPEARVMLRKSQLISIHMCPVPLTLPTQMSLQRFFPACINKELHSKQAQSTRDTIIRELFQMFQIWASYWMMSKSKITMISLSKLSKRLGGQRRKPWVYIGEDHQAVLHHRDVGNHLHITSGQRVSFNAAPQGQRAALMPAQRHSSGKFLKDTLQWKRWTLQTNIFRREALE